MKDLLDSNLLEKGRLVPNYEHLCVLTLVRDTLEILTPQATTHKIEFDIKSEINDNELLPVDSQRLQQVIINLISNAIKFSKPKSRILIELFTQT
jgi:signal transduction histidine kinase